MNRRLTKERGLREGSVLKGHSGTENHFALLLERAALRRAAPQVVARTPGSSANGCVIDTLWVVKKRGPCSVM